MESPPFQKDFDLKVGLDHAQVGAFVSMVSTKDLSGQ